MSPNEPKETDAESPKREDGTPTTSRRRKIVNTLLIALGVLALGYLLLLIPEGAPPAPEPADEEPFLWNRDALFDALEDRAADLRDAPEAEAEAEVARALGTLVEASAELEALAASPPPSPDAAARALLTRVEAAFFTSAALLCARPSRADELVELQANIRRAMKRLSQTWSVQGDEGRRLLYRMLYGTRAALEELLLQIPDPDDALVLARGIDEPSGSPSAVVRGVRVHSGDLLVSRGGAPTSALIARGSDHPGNFSHIALLHVDEAGTVSTIEAHIERGVVFEGLERYIADHKLRVMLLRPRADLPALLETPDLGHRAAEAA